jgi:hypothetical protein
MMMRAIRRRGNMGLKNVDWNLIVTSEMSNNVLVNKPQWKKDAFCSRKWYTGSESCS